MEHRGPYYPISYQYVGPNPAEGGGTNHPGNRDLYMIHCSPGQTNMSHEETTEGWLGQTGDWSATALGEFDTIEQAREACDADTERELRENWRGSGIPDHEDEDVAEVWVPIEREAGHLLTVEWDGEDPGGGLDCPEPTLHNGAEWLYSEDHNTAESEAVWDAAADAVGANHPHDYDRRDDIIAHLEALGWEVEEASHGVFVFVVGKRPAEAPRGLRTVEVDGTECVEVGDGDYVPENVEVFGDLDSGPWYVPVEQHVEACREGWFCDDEDES